MRLIPFRSIIAGSATADFRSMHKPAYRGADIRRFPKIPFFAERGEIQISLSWNDSKRIDLKQRIFEKEGLANHRKFNAVLDQTTACLPKRHFLKSATYHAVTHISNIHNQGNCCSLQP